jgi:hypothetical protein
MTQEQYTYTFDLDVLKTVSITIAMPVYENQVQLPCVLSLLSLSNFCVSNGLDLRVACGTNDALIPRVRNSLVNNFLREDSNYLFFIDSDISFDYRDVLELVYIAETTGKKILAGAYPRKDMFWGQIVTAINKQMIQSLEDFNTYSGSHSVQLSDPEAEVKFDEPQKAEVVSSGFMLIHRDVFHRIMENFADRLYRTDEYESVRYSFFECGVTYDPSYYLDSKFYASEDFKFCVDARSIGFEIWLCPWVNLGHTGTYTFKGSYMGALQASSEKGPN